MICFLRFTVSVIYAHYALAGKAWGAWGAQTRPTAAECSDLGVEQLWTVMLPALVGILREADTFPVT